MIDIFQQQIKGEADGFACIKYSNVENDIRGYKLIRLSTQEENDFIIEKSISEIADEDFFEFERFRFSKKALSLAEGIISDAIQNPSIVSIFLDEVGMLELQDRGYCKIFTKMIESQKNLFICINQKHIKAVMEKFGFNYDRCI